MNLLTDFLLYIVQWAEAVLRKIDPWLEVEEEMRGLLR